MKIEFATKEDLVEFKNEIVEELTNVNRNQAPNSWLRSAEVREMLSISSGTLQNMRTNGELPFTKIGSTLFYSMEVIQNILEKNKSVSRC